MINQLRTYRIDPELETKFLDRFRDHAARIMRDRYHFDIRAMWLSRKEAVRFVYLLSWPDADAMRSGWERFMADEEWSEVKRQSRIGSREPVLEVEGDLMLEAVSFSAAL